MTGNDASSTREKLVSDLLESADYIGNMKTRPRRLPPLIKDLVGTLDGDFIGIHTSPSSSYKVNGSRTLLRREDKHEIDKRLGDITKHGLKDISLGDNSVAKVAAAAAAAVLSDSEAKRETLRMNSINSEWEEALRWISSWEQNVHSNKGHMHQDGDDSPSSKGVHRKQNRRKRESRFNTENEIDFELFLDVCTERCLGNEGDERTSSYQYNREASDMATNKIQYEIIWAGNHLLSPFISILHGISSTPSVVQTWIDKQVIKKLFGVIFSSITIWFLRNLNDWRKRSQYTNSLRSLLEEEIREAKIIDPASKIRHTSSGKKTKKSRKKRRDNRSHQHDRKHTTSPTSDNESEASEESVDELFPSEELQRKNSEDQASKEGNTTVSSSTTDGVEFEYRMTATDETMIKRKANDWEMKDSKVRVSAKTFHNSARTKKSHRDQNFSNRKEVHSKKTDGHSLSQARSRDFKLSQGGCNIYVPTEKQREEAARKLIEFQQAQIQKIIDSHKEKKTNHLFTIQPNTYSPDKHIVLRDLAPSHGDSRASGNVDNKIKTIPPPPGFINGAKEDEIEDDADAGYLLSLLDEDDDEEEVPRQKFRGSPDRYCHSNEPVRSIALGDLLAGTYAGSSSGNLYISSNPWAKEESIGGSTTTAETFISSPSHSIPNNTSTAGMQNGNYCSNDANFCLQVSAMEFSPSADYPEDRTW